MSKDTVSAEQFQRAKKFLIERSALFHEGSDDVDYIASYMANFAEAELSALRGKETEPAVSAFDALARAEKDEGLYDRLPVVHTAAPRKHTTWTEVKAEMDAPPVALPTEEEERKEFIEKLYNEWAGEIGTPTLFALMDDEHRFFRGAAMVNFGSYVLARARRPLSLTTEKEKS